MPVHAIEGSFAPAKDTRFAIVAARFNDFIVDRLVDGALDTLRRHGVSDDNITLVRVPGAFELPVACKHLAEAGNVDAIIALGCVIRGATPHFEHVCSAATSGCGNVALTTGIPVAFGVLTTESIEQAIERAGTKAGNKGCDAALTAIEMASVIAQLSSGGSTETKSRSKKR